MASRRTRIKGIANIPQRRKNNATNEEQTEPQVTVAEKCTTENSNLPFDTIKKIDNEEFNFQPRLCVGEKLDNNLNIPISQSNNIPKSPNGNLLEKISESESLNSNKIVTYNETSNISNDTTELQDNKEPDQISENKIDHVPQKEQSKPLIRRKFIKPTVSASIINKRKQSINREKSETQTAERIEGTPKHDGNIEIIDLKKEEIFPKSTPVKNQELKYENLKLKQPIPVVVSKLNVENEITLDETHLTQNGIISKSEVPLDKNVKKIFHCTNNTQNSDNEYPPPPPSPSKINRSRIKAIPRLSNRKTSFSASESEDESRRNYNRNRNDSICSTTSGVTESIAECLSPQRPKEYSSIIQKKCNRTEQSRKLAEARREFQRRFGTNEPDRQRLTMIDLIFYNPATNPMKDEGKSKQDKEEGIQEDNDIQMDNESEKVDEPEPENENVSKSDEENEMPVPQIKIGPSGEIILDEKSLVIESKQVKKQREELQKTQLVDGDLNSNYGVYKRQKRSKNWTQNETLRFYKALNTIGTDFSLMCELFPRRTRRELKMKFKKEERINKALINKAVMQPCSFEFAELKREVDIEERELEELQKQKEDETKLKKQKQEEKISRKRKVSKGESADATSDVQTFQPKPPKIRKVKKPKIKKLSIESVLEDSDADESDIATQSESEVEVSVPLRPTRSGRVPKVTKKFDNVQPSDIDQVMKANKVSEDVRKNDIEPGSIMIMTEKGQNGEPVYKIYMVTPDQNATPLNLTSDVVSRAIEFKKGLVAQNIMTISASVTDDEADTAAVSEENNVTIPADETVTTLKEDRSLCNGDDTSKRDDRSLEENGVEIPIDQLDAGQRENLPDEHG